MGTGTSSGRGANATTPTANAPTATGTAASPTYGNDVTAIRTAILGILRDRNFQLLAISNPGASYYVRKDDNGGFHITGQEQVDRDDGFQGYQVNPIDRTFSDTSSAVRYIRYHIGSDTTVRSGGNLGQTLFRGANVGQRVTQNEMQTIGTTPRNTRYVRTRKA